MCGLLNAVVYMCPYLQVVRIVLNYNDTLQMWLTLHPLGAVHKQQVHSLNVISKNEVQFIKEKADRRAWLGKKKKSQMRIRFTFATD